MAFVSPLLNQDPIAGNNFFLPNFGMQMNPGASNPVNAAMTDAASTTSLTNTTFPAVPTITPGLNSVIGTTPVATNPLSTSTGLGMNTQSLGLLLGGIQTIGSLWQAWEANKLAQKEFEFNKDFATTNLENQTDAYNTTLENHSNARGGYEGWDRGRTRDYIRDHKLDKPKF